MYQVQTNSVHSPYAHITVNRNRVKNYGNTIYLKNETSFEIELWNPTKDKVLAFIQIDGKLISEKGIILRPGERIYLERWINTPHKFKFSTYEIENNLENKKAIEENGKISISFHQESTINYTNTSSFPIQPYDYPTLPYQQPYQQNYPFTITSGTTCNLVSSNRNLTQVTNYTASIETGRTETGESSSQKLVSGSGSFNSWASNTVNWQILPESSSHINSQKIRSYCTECGTRVRATSWKFCPSCGNKL